MYDGRVIDLRRCKELHDAFRAAEDAALEETVELERLRVAAEVATQGCIDALERWVGTCGGLSGLITDASLTSTGPGSPPGAGAPDVP